MAKIRDIEVPVLNIRGKDYPTVATRVQVAHQGGLGTGFSMVGWEIISAGQRDFLKVTLRMGEHDFIGTAEIHWNATGNSADATAPLETAETSAVGRALAFAGFIIDTIASADEMQRVTALAEAPRPLPERKAPPTVTQKTIPDRSAKIPTVAEQCAALAKSLNYSHESFLDLATQYKADGKTDWEGMKRQLMQEAEKKAKASSWRLSMTGGESGQ